MSVLVREWKKRKGVRAQTVPVLSKYPSMSLLQESWKKELENEPPKRVKQEEDDEMFTDPKGQEIRRFLVEIANE